MVKRLGSTTYTKKLCPELSCTKLLLKVDADAFSESKLDADTFPEPKVNADTFPEPKVNADAFPESDGVAADVLGDSCTPDDVLADVCEDEDVGLAVEEMMVLVLTLVPTDMLVADVLEPVLVIDPEAVKDGPEDDVVEDVADCVGEDCAAVDCVTAITVYSRLVRGGKVTWCKISPTNSLTW